MPLMTSSRGTPIVCELCTCKFVSRLDKPYLRHFYRTNVRLCTVLMGEPVLCWTYCDECDMS
jgi:hypothetical protein